MDSFSAFAMGLATSGNPLMVFDWDKAAHLIKKLGADGASAGLKGDWGYTGGQIFKDGKPVHPDDTYVYLVSTWATPEIEINGEHHECYKMQDDTPGWNRDTYWPESALAILGIDLMPCGKSKGE